MVLFRVDANEHLGMGHLMRCLSIALAFVAHNENVVFITSDNKSKCIINRMGFTSICLDTDWRNLESELHILCNIIRKNNPSLFIVDSYYVTEKYFHEVSRFTEVAYIDDINKSKWDTDILINYNIFAPFVDYNWYKGSKTKLLLGTKYAPLRKEFQKLPKRLINENVSSVFVSSGGSDPQGITAKIISNICPNYDDINFHIVIGAMNSKAEHIKTLASKTRNTTLHIDEKHISELMCACDVAISAAGFTLYELCACGTPTVTYTLADNQLFAAKIFSSENIMLNAGDCRRNDNFILSLRECLKQLVSSCSSERQNLSVRMQNIVDGNGANTLVNALCLMTKLKTS